MDARLLASAQNVHLSIFSLPFLSCFSGVFLYFQTVPNTVDYVEPEADHKLRHQRMLRDQIHEIDVAQSVMRRELDELRHHRLNDRFHAIEIEQHRLASANFNISRQVASLEKLHISMLELFEDVTDLQTKVDKIVPDLKHEISKMEFNAAQHASELNLLREEGLNNAKSIQALAVSMSALQDDMDRAKEYQQKVDKLQHDVEKMRQVSVLHRDMAHNRINKVGSVLFFFIYPILLLHHWLAVLGLPVSVLSIFFAISS